MHSTKTETMTLWVCVDCLFAREGELDTTPDCEPWGLLPGDDVSLGITWSEHDCGRETTHDMDTECECDCERADFSWQSCDGCGSTLAAERQAYTLWYAPDPTA